MHLSVSSSPRVILVGTVLRAAASVLQNSVLTQQSRASNSDVAAAAWVAKHSFDSPHKWFRSFTEVLQARETSCAEEYKRTHVKIDE